jgi:alkanesulfonate monooxygenase SsuD/methylene tetrahydromethanopterin reductase-like flavin-dependent oxidoreductase (luciferase family)
MFDIGLTDHLEGPYERSSIEIFEQVADLVRFADAQGVRYAWFAEHHAHAHDGHLPAPLLMALHLAGQTRRISLGTAVICLSLHHPLDIAEQIATADILTCCRLAPGFGSGSTAPEYELFGLHETDEVQRHAHFEAALRSIRAAWADGLPQPSADLVQRCWVAVNSEAAARIAGRMGMNVLFSHLRTPAEYRQYVAAYRGSGGRGRVAANRPVFVGIDDDAAIRIVEPALRTLWRRFREEGKIPAGTPEPASTAGCCAHPINFIVGGPATVARSLRELHAQCPFDVANLEIRWAGLTHEQVHDSLARLMSEVVPILQRAT